MREWCYSIQTARNYIWSYVMIFVIDIYPNKRFPPGLLVTTLLPSLGLYAVQPRHNSPTPSRARDAIRYLAFGQDELELYPLSVLHSHITVTF